MQASSHFLKRHALVIGIVLMFLLTWPIDLANSGVILIQFPFVVYLFLGWGIVFASLIMTWLTLGKDGVVLLLKRYLQWRASWKWYLVAFFLVPALLTLGVYLNAALTHTLPDFSTVMAHQIFGESAENLLLFILPFFIIEILSNGEEIGWRGYILPRLQAKFSALTSTLILALIWGFWHLPKYLPQVNPVFFGWFMVHIIAFAILLTWIYNNTKGSLLLVAICHASANTAGIFLPIANNAAHQNMGAYIVFALLEAVTAFVVVIIAGSQTLAKNQPKQVQVKK